MAKYAGNVGFAVTKETTPGVWEDVIEERKMRGDVIKSSATFKPGESINNDIALGHRISLLGDPYAYENFTGLRYITYMGHKFKIAGVEIERPRMIISMGGIYVDDE